MSPMTIDPLCESHGRNGLVVAARDHVTSALAMAQADWGKRPIAGPHPRDAAINMAREAAEHLQEVLSVEAPQDVVIDTRHALEELNNGLESLSKLDAGVPVSDRSMPLACFDRAIKLLNHIESVLTDPSRIGIP